MSVYTDWLTVLISSLNQVLAYTGISVNPDSTPTILLEKIRLATEQNYIIIIILDHEGKLIKSLNGHRAAVLSVSFSPDGQTLASASDDNTIILWNLNLDDLLVRGCDWVGDYLKHNRNLEKRDRLLCNGIASKNPF